ncbi:hypothetical protein ACLB2K_036738 [Fragaria x ananassa]
MAEFRLYNSMTQQKEVFKPLVPGQVSMYVCGVTAYALSHIGHARAAVNFDVLYRYLEQLGYKVTYVRNFTDVDDKIIRQANELGEDPISLSNRFCQEYTIDMGDLQCRTPTHEPRVSDHMGQIIDMITQIINNDYAYVVDGDVFFAVEKFPNYGRLSGQKLEHIRAGERVSVDSRKRNPADFALWKSAKPGEPSWDSPWGKGRPGWHIECSAMSAHYLTFKFDIHGGGIDLIFPHHENEIAQSCAACQEGRVSYWLHNGHVTNNNEKMSKSVGNFFTIRQLESASDAVYYIYNTLQECEVALSPFQEGAQKEGAEQNGRTVKITQEAEGLISKLENEFETKMSDDLNTASILTGAFQDVLRYININMKPLKKKNPKQQQLYRSLVETKKAVEKVLDTLGLLSSDTYSEVVQQLKAKALIRAGLSEDDVLRTIAERTLARKNKDFAKSDQIREEMEEKGIQIMDVGNESIWRPKALKE